MSLGHWLAIMLSVGLALELWTGAAFVPWSAHRSSRPVWGYLDHIVRRDEFSFPYWLAIGLHSAVVALFWWRLLH